MSQIATIPINLQRTGRMTARLYWPAESVRILGGAVLLVAAILKTASPWKLLELLFLGKFGVYFAAVLVGVEAAVGSALVLRVAPRRTCRIAGTCFAAFSLYSGYLLTMGAASCGCFGSLRAPIWAVVSFDVVMAGLLLHLSKRFDAKTPIGRRRARAGVSIATGLFMAILLPVLTGYLHSEAAVAITVDQRDVDLGSVVGPAAWTISHRFLLTNNTTHPVMISDVTHTCTCTSANATATVIPPDDTIGVDVAINWGDRRGRQVADVTVRTANPQGIIDLSISGVVNPGLAISPSAVNFGRLSPIAVSRREIALARTDGLDSAIPPKLERIITSTPAVAVDPLPSRGDDTVEWFAVRLSADRLAAGRGEAEITFIPVDGRLAPLTLPIIYLRLPDLEPTVDTARFRKQGEINVIRFTQFRPDARPDFRIVGLNSASAFTIRSIRHLIEGRDQLVDVSVESNHWPTGTVSAATLVAEIDHMEAARVSLLQF